MLFEETQYIQPERSRRTLLIACLIILAAYVISITILLFNGGFSSENTYYYFPTIMIVVFIVLYVQKFTVTVTEGSLTITGGKKRIMPISDILSVRTERFEKVTWRYGIGVKYNGKRGYLTANAEEGVSIEMKDGGSFLISSKRSGELEKALKDAMGAGDEGTG